MCSLCAYSIYRCDHAYDCGDGSDEIKLCYVIALMIYSSKSCYLKWPWQQVLNAYFSWCDNVFDCTQLLRFNLMMLYNFERPTSCMTLVSVSFHILHEGYEDFILSVFMFCTHFLWIHDCEKIFTGSSVVFKRYSATIHLTMLLVYNVCGSENKCIDTV